MTTVLGFAASLRSEGTDMPCCDTSWSGRQSFVEADMQERGRHGVLKSSDLDASIFHVWWGFAALILFLLINFILVSETQEHDSGTDA